MKTIKSPGGAFGLRWGIFYFNITAKDTDSVLLRSAHAI